MNWPMGPLVAVVLLAAGAQQAVAQTNAPCEFTSKSGELIEFLGSGALVQAPGDDVGPTDPNPYAVVRGHRCTFDAAVTHFACGNKATKVENYGTYFVWKGVRFDSTNNCSLGPE
jgi:hypothetical protein